MKTPLFTLNSEELFPKLERIVNDARQAKNEMITITKRINNILLAVALEYDVILTTALIRTLVNNDFASPEAKKLFLSAFENALSVTEIVCYDDGEVDSYSTFHQVLSNVRNVQIHRVLRNEYPVLALLEDFES